MTTSTWPLSCRVSLAAVLLLGVAVATDAETIHVRNDAPQQPPRTLHLEEQWRAGGEDEEVFFGMIVGAVCDDTGNIYLLDSQLCQVEVFAPDGEQVNTLSGQGEGPGEVANPQDLVWMPDGSLGILELFPGQFVTLARDGTPGSTVRIGNDGSPQTGFIVTLGACNRGGTLLVAGQVATQIEAGQDRTQFLASFDPGGRELVRYREAHMVLDFNAAVFDEAALLPAFYLTHTVGPDGRVYVPASRDRYAIEVYHPDGNLDRVIERTYEPRKRDEREFNRMNALVDAWMQGFPGEIARDLASHEPVITDLRVDSGGVLWVQHSRSDRDRPEGVLLRYDTFDADGNYLQEVHVVAEGDPAYDGVRWLDDGRALVIKGYVLARWASRGARNATFGEDDTSGPMEIICCRVEE